MKELKVRVTMLDEILGSQPASEEIHREYIASKAPDATTLEEEVAAIGVDAEEEKKRTIFYRYNGKPALKDYQIRGFFKSAASFFGKMSEKEVQQLCGHKLPKLKAFKKTVDGLVFIYSMDGGKFLPLNAPTGAEITSCQRPLRGQTPMGETISLANSEALPAGTTLEFKVRVLTDNLMEYIEGWLSYGRYNGLCQWRNSGKGSFKWEKIGDWYDPED